MGQAARPAVSRGHALSWAAQLGGSGHELWGRGLGEGGDSAAKTLPGTVKPMEKGRPGGGGGGTGDPHPGEGQFFCSHGERGLRQSRGWGGGRELRLRGEPDLGFSLVLPLTKFVTLGDLLASQSLSFLTRKWGLTVLKLLPAARIKGPGLL